MSYALKTRPSMVAPLGWFVGDPEYQNGDLRREVRESQFCWGCVREWTDRCGFERGFTWPSAGIQRAGGDLFGLRPIWIATHKEGATTMTLSAAAFTKPSLLSALTAIAMAAGVHQTGTMDLDRAKGAPQQDRQAHASPWAEVTQAVAVIRPTEGNDKVSGTIRFEQTD